VGKYKAVIAVMAVVIVGLLCGVMFLLGRSSKDSGVTSSEMSSGSDDTAVTDSSDEKSADSDDGSAKASDEQASDDADSSTKSSDEKADSDKSDSKEKSDSDSKDKKNSTDKSEEKSGKSSDSSAYKKTGVSFSENGSWENQDGYVVQYDVNIMNSTDEDISDWSVEVSGFTGGEIGDSWSGNYEIEGDILTITPVDYNETVTAGGSTQLGLQVVFESEEAAGTAKTATLYAEGKEVSSGGSSDKSDAESVEDSEDSSDSSASSDKSDDKADASDDAAAKSEDKASSVETASGTPFDKHGALSIDGTDIVDVNGDRFELMGVSTHGIAWFPQYVNKDAFTTVRDIWGANLIRLSMYTAESGGYCQDGDKDELKGLIDDGVKYATELGMYVIIDWHILSDGDPNTNKDEALDFFEEISSKYADYDNVIYEICNEPNGGTTWSDVKSYAEEVIPVIRKNTDAIIIVGTPTWSQDVDAAADDPLTGFDNIAYAVHFYAATHKDNIRDKVTYAHDKGLCVFISEFSICDASGNGGIDYDSADAWFNDIIYKYNLSFAGWSISNKAETSAFIKSSCDKTSGWSDDELSDTGLWLKNQISDNKED